MREQLTRQTQIVANSDVFFARENIIKKKLQYSTINKLT